MKLVTINQVRDHCRADSDDDAMLAVYADAAEQQVTDFLNRRVCADQAELDNANDPDAIVANPAIVAAVLLTTGHLFRNRESVAADAAIELPMGVTHLLWPHRIGLGA